MSTSVHFNALRPDEAERLAILTEECGEVSQCVGKILRHGYESFNPNNAEHQGNRHDLEKECGDILAAIQMLVDSLDLRFTAVQVHKEAKLQSIKRYLHHQ